jgi:hypothetical protein
LNPATFGARIRAVRSNASKAEKTRLPVVLLTASPIVTHPVMVGLRFVFAGRFFRTKTNYIPTAAQLLRLGQQAIVVEREVNDRRTTDS